MSQSTCADDALAWYGVVADPARRLDLAIERRHPLAGKVVLEVGRHATSHALRHAARVRQVYSAKSAEIRPSSSVLPPNVSLIHPADGAIPLRDQTVDVAILRADASEQGPLSVQSCLFEFDRLLVPAGLAVGIRLGRSGELGALLDGVLQDRGPQEEEGFSRFFEELGFEEEIVDSTWQAPGRSVLRRLLAAEWGDAAAFQSLTVSELGCVYQVFWRRRA